MDARRANALPSTTIDVVDFFGFDDLATAALPRVGLYGSVVVCDPMWRRFAGFIIMWWRGNYVVRGEANTHIGTYVTVEAAIRAGQVVSVVGTSTRNAA